MNERVMNFHKFVLNSLKDMKKRVSGCFGYYISGLSILFAIMISMMFTPIVVYDLNEFYNIPRSSADVDDSYYEGVNIGQVIIWKIESDGKTSFLKINITYFNETVILGDTYEYNWLGILKKTANNVSIPFILANNTFKYIIQLFGSLNRTEKIADRDILIIPYETNTTKIYYDYQTGIICYSEVLNETTGSVDKIELVSWTDCPVSNFVNYTWVIIGSAGALVVVIGVVIFIKKRRADV